MIHALGIHETYGDPWQRYLGTHAQQFLDLWYIHTRTQHIFKKCCCPSLNPTSSHYLANNLPLEHPTPQQPQQPQTPTLAQCLPLAQTTTFPSPAPSSLSTHRRSSLPAPQMYSLPHSPSSLLTGFFPIDQRVSSPRHQFRATAAPEAFPTLPISARHLLQPQRLSIRQSLARRFSLLLRLTRSTRFHRRMLRK